MSRYDHKIETSLEGIENLSKEKKEKDVCWAVSFLVLEMSSCWQKIEGFVKTSPKKREIEIKFRK